MMWLSCLGLRLGLGLRLRLIYYSKLYVRESDNTLERQVKEAQCLVHAHAHAGRDDVVSCLKPYTASPKRPSDSDSDYVSKKSDSDYVSKKSDSDSDYVSKKSDSASDYLSKK